MINKLSKTTSLRNLRCGDCAGQIATFILLILVVVLILIMVFVNIGEVALTATKVSTVADAAALSLGSQLLSRAAHFRNIMRQPLPGGTYIEGTETSPPKICKSNGILDVILGFIVAAIVILATLVIVILTGGLAAPVLVAVLAGAGLLGGGIGGYIGGGLQSRVTAAGDRFRWGGASTWNSALSGMAIGLAMGLAVGGACVFTGVGVAAAPPQVSTSVVGFSEALTKAAEATAAGAKASMIPAASDLFAPVITGLTQVTITMPGVASILVPEALVAAILLTGGAQYLSFRQSVEIGQKGLKNLAAAFSSFARALRGLPQPDQIKEGIALQVLSNIVDDPQMTNSTFEYDCNHDGSIDPQFEVGRDPCDVDGDGNYTESTPMFAYWWLDRLNMQKIKVDKIKDFLKGYIYRDPVPKQRNLPEFKAFLKGLISNVELESPPRAPGIFCRQNNKENLCCIKGNLWQDSPVIFFLRRLMDIGLWNTDEEKKLFSGSRPAQLGQTPVDTMDLIWYNLQQLDESLEELIDEGTQNSFYTVISDWRFWFDQFSQAPYKDDKPLPEVVFYGTPPGWANPFPGLEALRNKIQSKMESLTACVVDPTTGFILPPNPVPCKNYSWNGHSYEVVAVPYPPGGGLYSKDIKATIEKQFIVEQYVPLFTAFNQYLYTLYGPGEYPGGDYGIRNWLDQLEQGLSFDPPHPVYGRYYYFSPAYYNWTDSRGKHSVSVEMPAYFDFARMEMSEKDSFNNYVKEICFYLDHYSGSGNDHWVKVTRMDEARKSAGLLGVWNPWANYHVDGEWLRVTRKTKVEYGLYQGASYRPFVKIKEKTSQW